MILAGLNYILNNYTFMVMKLNKQREVTQKCMQELRFLLVPESDWSSAVSVYLGVVVLETTAIRTV